MQENRIYEPGERVASGLAVVESLGITVSPEQVIQALHIAAEFGSTCTEEELWDYLIPIFAKNPDEQVELYEALFQSPPEAPAAESDYVPDQHQNPLSSTATSFTLPALIIFVALAVGLWLFASQKPKDITYPPGYHRPSSRAGSATLPPANSGQSQPTGAGRGTGLTRVPTLVTTHTLNPIYIALLIVLGIIGYLLYSLLIRTLLSRRKEPGAPYTRQFKYYRLRNRLFQTPDLHAGVRMLNGSFDVGRERIDVNRTIKETVSSGVIQLAYKPTSRRPSYLALINYRDPNDHYASSAASMVYELRAQNLIIDIAYSMVDPRQIRIEDQGVSESLTLEQLQDRFPLHHLLYFSVGDELFEPRSGRLRRWAESLLDWDQITLLRPTNIQTDLSESQIARHFRFLTATTENLRFIAKGNPRAATPENSSPIPNSNVAKEVAEWREYLGEATFQWLCTLALYDEVHWDLILRMSSVNSLGRNVLNERNLAKLLKVPYLSEPFLPSAFRYELLRNMDPDVNEEAGSILVQYLEDASHDSVPNSYAESTRQLELAFYRWRHSQSDRDWRVLRDTFRSLSPDRANAEKALVSKLLSSRKISAGPSLQRLFSYGGVPGFGPRLEVTRIAIVALAIVVAGYVFLPQSEAAVSRITYIAEAIKTAGSIQLGGGDDFGSTSGGQPTKPLIRAVSVTPPAIDFGPVEISERGSSVVLIKNLSSTVADQVDVRIAGKGPFNLLDRSGHEVFSDSLSLSPGQVRELTVDFSPSETSNSAGSLLIHDRRGEENFTIPLSAFGGVKPIVAEPGELAFSFFGAPSRPVRLRNRSRNPVIVDMSIQGTGEFSINGETKKIVPGSSTTNVDINFTTPFPTNYAAHYRSILRIRPEQPTGSINETIELSASDDPIKNLDLSDAASGSPGPNMIPPPETAPKPVTHPAVTSKPPISTSRKIHPTSPPGSTTAKPKPLPPKPATPSPAKKTTPVHVTPKPKPTSRPSTSVKRPQHQHLQKRVKSKKKRVTPPPSHVRVVPSTPVHKSVVTKPTPPPAAATSTQVITGGPPTSPKPSSSAHPSHAAPSHKATKIHPRSRRRRGRNRNR